MEWSQVLTIMGTMLAGVFAFYQITKQEIGIIREQIILMNTHHREDMNSMDAKLVFMDSKLVSIDEKWERLFERLLIQDKKGR